MSTQVEIKNRDYVKQLVQSMLDVMLNEEFEKLKEQALKNIERRKGEIVAGIMIDLLQQAEVETMGEKIIVTIKKPKDEG